MEKHTAEWRRSKHLRPSEKAEIERAEQLRELADERLRESPAGRLQEAAAENCRAVVKRIKDRVIKRMRRAKLREDERGE